MDVPAAAFARPVINVTVPIQTLMGVSDDPGCLSGGTVVPATLARMIARQPGSTWHRMLTDEAGRCVEVSTRSYSPTHAIWNDVVARWWTCFRAGCDRPATDCQLDHRVPFPRPGRPATATCSRPASGTTGPSTPTGSPWSTTAEAGRRGGPGPVFST